MSDQTSPSVLSSHTNLWFTGTVISLGVAAALFLLGPGDGSPCLIRAATGISCPGCGMTRAAAAMLRGDWAGMWRFHPLAPFVAAQGVVVWAIWGWRVLVRKRAMNETFLLWLLIGNTTLLAVGWLVRLLLGTLPGP